MFGFQDVWDLVQGGVESVTESSTDAQKATQRIEKERLQSTLHNSSVRES
jgi:hypothetical protein